MTRPGVFIGSSSEGKRFALAVQAALQPAAEVTTWDQGIFSSGQTFIEALLAALSRFDFAVLVLTPDDVVQSRTNELASPRDNIIFELGLFMGTLGRDRTFILQPPGSGIKIPTDLAGVTTDYYDWPRGDNNYRAAVATASDTIAEKIRLLGKRGDSANNLFAGLDPNLVVESDGVVSARVSGCEITIVTGRIEKYPATSQTVVVLPCNEYFDDECACDTRSALGAYVNNLFPAQVQEFISHVKTECERHLGPGTVRQKRENEQAVSFGPGRALLLQNVLGSKIPIALVATTMQRARQGLTAKASFLFEGMCELVTRLADERLNELVMPILGAGHGGWIRLLRSSACSSPLLKQFDTSPGGPYVG